MKEKEYSNWKKFREKGLIRFLLVNGVLSWGAPMFFIMTFVVNNTFKNGFDLGLLLIQIAIWTTGGLCFGYAMWITNEKRFNKAAKKYEESLNSESIE